MKFKKILILVDSPLRDLPSSLLLATHLSSDAKIYLSPTNQAAYEIFTLNPDLVILNYLRESNKNLVKKLINAGINFSILDTEGGFSMKIPDTDETSFTMTIIKESEIREKALHYFCWGKDLYGYLEKNRTYKNNTHLTGTPRTDFYHESFKDYFGNIDDLKFQLTGKKQPTILINTSFPGNNPKFSDRSTELNMLINKFGYTHQFMSDFFDKLDIVMADYIALTAYLAKEFPQVHFVLRAHPFENEKIYTSKLGHFPNVQVSCINTVTPWLVISEALVHYECSTAAEALFMKKPAFSLKKHKNVRTVPEIQSLTEYADDFEHMKSLIENVLQKKHQLPELIFSAKALVEESIFYKVDGMAARRIAAIIKSTEVDSKKTLVNSIFHFVYTFEALFKKVVKKVFYKNAFPSSKKIVLEAVKAESDNITNITSYKNITTKPFLSSSVSITRGEVR